MLAMKLEMKEEALETVIRTQEQQAQQQSWLTALVLVSAATFMIVMSTG